MNAHEFAEWQAYHRIYPFGEGREDARAGVIASVISNVYRKKGTKPRVWQDFFPQYSARAAKGDWRAMLAKVVNINKALGGEDKRQAPADP